MPIARHAALDINSLPLRSIFSRVGVHYTQEEQKQKPPHLPLPLLLSSSLCAAPTLLPRLRATLHTDPYDTRQASLPQ